MPTIAIVRYTSPGEDGATFMGYLASLRSPNHNPEQYSLWPVRKAIEPQFKLAAMVNEHGSWPRRRDIMGHHTSRHWMVTAPIGPDLFRTACQMGLEGLVSKRRDRPYQAGRSKHWIKIKNRAHPAMGG
jgi:hypothetical protein